MNDGAALRQQRPTILRLLAEQPLARELLRFRGLCNRLVGYMKYFDYKLAQSRSSKNPDLANAAERLWERDAARYKSELNKFKNLLPRALVALELYDAAVLGVFVRRDKQKTNNDYVEVAVRQGERVMSLLYWEVEKIEFKYALDGPGGAVLGDWLADEMNWLGNGKVEHEILLRSGAGLLLQFSSFEIRQ